jgi:hypothetical protein
MDKYAKYERDRRKSQYRKRNLYWKRNKKWFLQYREFDGEIFKEIPNYLGFYFISNYGRVISFSRSRPHELNTIFKNGSMTIVLSLAGKREEHKIQDLVYKCFKEPLPLELELEPLNVEHINGNPRDNYYKNLILIHPAESSSPGSISENETAGAEPAPFHLCKEVLQFDLYGNYLKKFPSLNDAAASVNAKPSSISQCLNKRSDTSAGFQWFYRTDPLFANGIRSVPPAKTPCKEILQFALSGKYLRSFPTITEAAKKTKIYRHWIQDNLKGHRIEAKGFQFRYRRDPLFRLGIRDIPPVTPTPKQKHPKAREVAQFDLDGLFIAEYSSINKAAKATGASPKGIADCLKGELESSGGFQWRYRFDPLFRRGICNIAPLARVTGLHRPGVLQFDLKGKFIREFIYAIDAAKTVGVNCSGIRKCISGTARQSGGFQWRSINDPRFKNGIIDIPPLRYPPRRNYRAVLKFNRMGRLVAEYSSINEAARENHIATNTLRCYLKGHIPETADFYWKYKEKNDKKTGRKPSRSDKKKSKR